MTEQELNRPGFNPGGLPEIKDQRDLQWNDIGTAVLPYDWDQNYDVRKELRSILNNPSFNMPVKDQDGSGSCGGQATASYNAVIEAVATKSYEEESAKFVIAQTFIVDADGKMLGSFGRDNANLAVKQGVAREAVCPSYNNGMPPTDAFMNRLDDITEAAREDAKANKSKSYAFVDPNVDSYAQAISINHGILATIGGENNGTWLSTFPKPPTYRQWGHFMYFGSPEIIGGKKGIWGIQSWGKNVGDNGWQWFGEDYFLSGFIYQGITLFRDDSVPVPPKYLFTRDLSLGSSGIDVKFLQVFLNNHGYKLASTGPGSTGLETSFFGNLTKDAVSRFQASNGIKPAVGYFGPLTRAKVNATPAP